MIAFNKLKSQQFTTSHSMYYASVYSKYGDRNKKYIL